MYQMWYGVSLYEKALKSARDDQAKKENKKPEEVQVDLATVNFEKARDHLKEAIKLNKDMWRAHYYLGRIYRVVKTDSRPRAPTPRCRSSGARRPSGRTPGTAPGPTRAAQATNSSTRSV